MKIPKADYPVPYHPTFSIHDATKTGEFKECPRKYLYRYVLGWTSETPNLHLEFGAAYHLALEHLLTHGYEPASIRDAYNKFFDHYSQFFSEEREAENAPKNAANALLSLAEYCENYRNIDKFEVLHTEVVGTVPIADDRRLHFRIDAIVKDSTGIWLLEHKTGSKDSATWRSQWLLSSQVSIYTHVLFCMYGDEVWGAKVNGIILRKKGNVFIRVPVRKTKESMQTWLWTINHTMSMIKWEFERLLESKSSDPVLTAFPINDKACTNWGTTCIYHAYCIAWQNPLTRCEQVPPGLKVAYWNPEEAHKKIAKKEVEL